MPLSSSSKKRHMGLVVLVALLFALPLVPSTSAQNPVYGVDDRVFPEPMLATSFLQWPDFVEGIETLEAEYPDYMEVYVIGESLQGRPIYFVELTNENSGKVREDKLQIGYSASIHANEAAGREGMVRAMEDLVSGTGPLGDMQGTLDDIIINIWFPNPDSWASGDYFTVDPERIFEGAPSYYRENFNGTDLNRQFPNPGTKIERHTPMSEPESKAVVKELRYSGRHENLVAGTDLHGMINSPNMMRAIIPNQDMDFHRMMHAVRFLNDLEDRINNNEHFMEWDLLAEALCLVPEVEEPYDPHGSDPGQDGHAHGSDADDPFAHLSPEEQELIAQIDDGDGVWSLEEALQAQEVTCGNITDGPTGGVGHGKPFLWGARWDQIGYTDSGFTSDYLMLSPRSPTGGMGAVGTITEFAYSHMVPNNNYVAKLNDMHVAGVRETVRTQIEYTLLLEQPRLTGTGPVLYVENPQRVTSENDTNPYESEHGRFSIGDASTWFDFDQVAYDVANTDFWAELAQYSDDPVDGVAPADLTAGRLAEYDHLAVTDRTIDHVDVDVIQDWVESGGNLILTDAALKFFDEAGLTSGAAFRETYYLGHSDLVEDEHPLLAGVEWNARQTGEAIPIGYEMNEYPQWHLSHDAVSGLDLQVAGTTGEAGDPSLGTVRLGDGAVHFIGGALPQPTQHNDHRYGLAPYALTALSYYVFINALGGEVDWQPRDEPFVPYYPADPLYGDPEPADDELEVDETVPGPGFALFVILVVVGVAGLGLRRKR